MMITRNQTKIKTVLTLAVLVMAISPMAATSQADDIFSLNFYMYPWPWTTQEQFDTITLEPDQSAGFDTWLTDGWENIVIPWAPPGPQDPVTITSNQGSEATYTLTNARNGGAYFWDAPRTTLPGDGNADMMDGHANGTEDGDFGVPSLPDEIVDITVSDIPFAVYDAIFYIVSQESQFIDGTGKIVFNGVERDFTLKSGIFDGTFTEIVDGVTAGNYIVYKGVTGSSFTTQVWGNGFNHLGPCGLQLRNAGVRNPSPADGSNVSIGDVDLSWTNADPNNPADPVYVDVWFGTDPDPKNGTQVVTAEPDTTTVQVSAPTEGTYYWQVVNYINGAGHINEPNAIEGPVWSFNTVEDLAPTVVIDTPDQMTWSGQPVPLDATVTDDGLSALTIAWTADPAAGVTVEFDPNPSVEDPTVKITKVPYSEPTIVNHGFEIPPLDDNESVNTSAGPGWTEGYYSGDETTWNPYDGFCGAIDPNAAYGYGGVAPEGENIAWCRTDAGYDDGVSQTLPEVLQAETQYDLNVMVGTPGSVSTPASWRIELLAGNVKVKETSGDPPASDNWITASLTYNTGSAGTDPTVGQPITIRLLGTDDNGTSGVDVNFDDVRLTADPPFPARTGVETVTLTVAVSDAANPTTTDTDTIEIDVYDDACKMARMGLGLSNISDLDNNCITDLRDYAVLAADWLVDYALTAPVPKP